MNDGWTIAGLQCAYENRDASCSGVVEQCLSRIEEYDRGGPALNCVLGLDADRARRDAEMLDARIERGGGLAGPLHGVPVLVKDQIDVAGLPTTLGSTLLRAYYPQRDARAVAALRDAGAIIVGKTTLGEMGAGDAFGSLYGATRNPYDPSRTCGGSSGGSGVAVSAGMCQAALGQEGVASISRPAAWNCVVGFRPSAGLVSRAGAFSGWPNMASSIGPMGRCVDDVARMFAVIVGYDPEDPATALGFGRHEWARRDEPLVRRPRVGVLRTSIGHGSEPDTADYAEVMAAFDAALAGLSTAATVIDPVTIADLAELLRRRAFAGIGESFDRWIGRGGRRPYTTFESVIRSPEYRDLYRGWPDGAFHDRSTADYGDYLAARDLLRIRVLQVMAEHDLDAIVYRAVEHSPTFLAEGLEPPYVNGKGAVSLNTFLGDVPAVTLPGPFTSSGLPTGVTFLGRPFADAVVLGIGRAYEAATRFRRPPPLGSPAGLHGNASHGGSHVR